MPVDFREAAERHWTDGDSLFRSSRLANADHLLGLAAECALKAVMQALGMPLHPDGRPVDKQHHQVHINKLWDEFVTFAHARGGARYALTLGAVPNPFADWDVAQRYDHSSSIGAGQAARHQSAAQTARQVLEQAILDGVV